jgi:peroxiredoxin
MRKHLIILFILFCGSLPAQNIMDGTIQGLGKNRVYLLSHYGEKITPRDSTISDTLGRFSFILEGNYLPGMYRVQWGTEGLLDLIWNHENITFSTHKLWPDDSLQIQSSLENRLYYAYSRMDRLTQSKLELIMPLVDYYPVKDSFYRIASREMERMQQAQQFSLDSLQKLYPNTLAIRIFKAYQTPFISAGMNRDERLNYLKQHYFDKVDFTDTALLRTTVFANKAISYLSLYSNNKLSQKQLEAEFIKAVTIMLSATSVNAEVYKFFLDYLVGGFDKYHFDEVITYLAENFQDPYSCEDQQRKSSLQKKLENYKKIAIGKPAPDFSLPDPKGKIFRLSAIPAEYTLLVFWSAECQHCRDMMPRLKTLYDNQKAKRFEVITVSVDTSRTNWLDIIRTGKLNWINTSDLKGFAGQAVDEYNIYATPTMFLLDREKKIVAKPISFRDLDQSLREHKLIP